MGLLSFFKRSKAAGAAPSSAASGDESIEQARTRARHRLIGAVVLVVIGVIGFPLLFETQPRPIPVDLPIEIPKKEAAAPLPAAKPTAPRRVSQGVIDESLADAGKEVLPPAEEPKQIAAPAAAKPVESNPEPKPAEAKPAPVKPAAEKPAKPAPAKPEAVAKPRESDSARVQALLNGQEAAQKPKPEAKAEAVGRFVVQVGAYGEADSARSSAAALMRRQVMGPIATTLAERGAGSISAISPATPPTPISPSMILLSPDMRKTSTLPERMR